MFGQFRQCDRRTTLYFYLIFSVIRKHSQKLESPETRHTAACILSWLARSQDKADNGPKITGIGKEKIKRYFNYMTIIYRTRNELSPLCFWHSSFFGGKILFSFTPAPKVWNSWTLQTWLVFLFFLIAFLKII